MKKNIFQILNKAYGIMMFISFFAGIIPVFPFILAIIFGGKWGENIALFLYNQYYPWVIIIGSIAIIMGLVAMYIGKIEGLSINSTQNKKVTKEEK